MFYLEAGSCVSSVGTQTRGTCLVALQQGLGTAVSSGKSLGFVTEEWFGSLQLDGR